VYWVMRSCCNLSEPMLPTRDPRATPTSHSVPECRRIDLVLLSLLHYHNLNRKGLLDGAIVAGSVVYSSMSCEIVKSRESFATLRALVWPFSFMTELMIPAMVAA
jgi:hypothetical protein